METLSTLIKNNFLLRRTRKQSFKKCIFQNEYTGYALPISYPSNMSILEMTMLCKKTNLYFLKEYKLCCTLTTVFRNELCSIFNGV